MLPHITAISSLLLGIAFFLLGNSLLGTLLQLRGIADLYSATTIGLFMSAYYAGFFAGNWVTMPVIRRIGHIRAFALFASLASVVALLHVLIPSPWVWMGLRFIYGISAISIYIIIESWLNTQAPNALRGRIFAIYMVANFLAQATGQQLLRLDQTLGFVLFAAAAICISASLTPIMLTRRMQPPPPTKRSSNLRALIRTTPLPLLASCASGLNSGAFWGMGSAYMSMKGFDIIQVSTMMTATIIGGALFQYPIGRLSDRFDRRRVLFAVTLAAAICSAAIIFALSDTWLPWIFFFWGGLSFCIYPLAVAQLIDQLKVEDMLSGTTSLLLVNGIGAMCAPILAGLLMQTFGHSALPYLFVTITSLLAIYIFFRIRRATDHVTDAPAQFVPMVHTSEEVLEMMPEPEANPNPAPATPAPNGPDADHAMQAHTTDGADATVATPPPAEHAQVSEEKTIHADKAPQALTTETEPAEQPPSSEPAQAQATEPASPEPPSANVDPVEKNVQQDSTQSKQPDMPENPAQEPPGPPASSPPHKQGWLRRLFKKRQ